MTVEKPLNVEDVADLLGVAPATLRYWRWANQGPKSYKNGKRICYDPADVRAWMAHRKDVTARGEVF